MQSKNNKSLKEVDFLIVGAGTAGLRFRSHLEGGTHSYLVVDPRGIKTTCASEGCMPSKSFLEKAEVVRKFRSSGFIDCQGSQYVDVAKILKRVRSDRDYFVDSLQKKSVSWAGDFLVEASAEFTSPNTMKLSNGLSVKAKHIVLATGSAPIIPKNWRKFQKCLWTSRDLIEQEKLPDEIAVVGLGAIGLEYASALADLGVHVQAFNADSKFLSLNNDKVRHKLIRAMESKMSLHYAEPVPVSEKDGKLTLQWADQKVGFHKVLMCTGRSPNLEGLHLEALGIDGEEAIKRSVESAFEISPNVYLLGDANESDMLIHEANLEADELARHLLGRSKKNNSNAVKPYRPFMRLTFSNPQVAQIGKLSEDQKASNELDLKYLDTSEIGRSYISGDSFSAIAVWVERQSQKLVAAECVGERAEHWGQELSWMIARGMTVDEIQQLPFYHPTYEESLQSVIRN